MKRSFLTERSFLGAKPDRKKAISDRKKDIFEQNLTMDFTGGSESKVSAYNVGDLGLIPGSGRSLGEGNGNPLQYSCL